MCCLLKMNKDPLQHSQENTYANTLVMHALQCRSSKWIIHICSSVKGMEGGGGGGCRQNEAMREYVTEAEKTVRQGGKEIKGKAKRNSSLLFLKLESLQRMRDNKSRKRQEGKKQPKRSKRYPSFLLPTFILNTWLTDYNNNDDDDDDVSGDTPDCFVLYPDHWHSQEHIVPQREECVVMYRLLGDCVTSGVDLKNENIPLSVLYAT